MADDNDWVSQYRGRLLAYQEFAARIESLVTDLLRRRAIDFAQIESRAKKIESFEEKIARKRYAEPLDQMTDLVGIRVVTYYQEDVETITKLVKSEFHFYPDLSSDSRQAEDPTSFGYSSLNYVLSLADPRASLTEWLDFRHIRFEVQVRTILQHAWAAISHKLAYKRQNEVPRELRRSLSRLSALIELADSQFSDVRDASRRVADGYQAKVDRGELDLPLDMASLTTYLARSNTVTKLRSAIQAAGAPLEGPNQDRLESDQRDLLTLLIDNGITSVKELDGLLADARLLKALSLIGEIEKWHGEPPFARSLEEMTALLLTVWLGDVETYGLIFTPVYLISKDTVFAAVRSLKVGQ